MKLLLDEDVPEELRFFIPGHDVRTVRFMGWKSWPDGSYLPLTDSEFDAMLTCDQSIPDQQNLSRLSLRVIVLHGRSNRIEDLLPLLPETLQVLEEPERGQVVHIYPP